MQSEHFEVTCYECESTVHFPIDQPFGSCKCGVYIILREFPAGNPLPQAPVFDDDQSGREMKVGMLAI